jgi:hypothetical protein
MKDIPEWFYRQRGRIERALPDATPSMISAFMQQHGVGMTTVAAWAEQGSILIDDGGLHRVVAMDVNESSWLDQAMALLDELQREAPKPWIAAEILAIEIAIAERRVAMIEDEKGCGAACH